ncbi:Short chain dehydrogenase citE like protein [Verticillium longisporum]|uniref:NAD(P)-binding protein n=3 Tax=Verticillium TaxID=1036719 RepID=G2X877_VERDV|nr:uncharacterized protein VDAG_06018 [Verticillium dahliae VdLs.17]KAF3342402.1 Pyruvate kinase [Verticillium dahliae VDG2]KAF3358896.1 hypothetical protein VdG1_02458 [Verticillium dahliae VDG1]KAG7128531.1 Short chain dehydrogenase citE like protein [Verticillium longisporum]KAH6697798.1 hypothetical protein EV126DRAFT_60133 [Verticillium dahliae]EGY15164.1 hypothetical protein VDAG_06018 [Verticillium dahliae VdLs.17]
MPLRIIPADASGLPPRQIDLFTGPNIHHDAYPEIHPRHSPHAGKSVLITGASQGLGRAIAIGYARAGATRIALAARTDLTTTTDLLLAAAEEESQPAPEVLALEMDVTDAASVRAAAARLDEAWAGRLDILVCNAGYMASFAQLLEADEEDLIRTFDVNYWGTYRCCRAFVPIMISGGGDRTVVTLTSIAAHFIGGGSGAYSLSKFALVRLTEFLQDEYASQGVLAYSVHPGAVSTGLSDKLPEKYKFRLTETPELIGHSLPFLTSQKRDWLGGRWVSSMWDLPKLLTMEKEVVAKDLLKFKCTGLN